MQKGGRLGIARGEDFPWEVILPGEIDGREHVARGQGNCKWRDFTRSRCLMAGEQQGAPDHPPKLFPSLVSGGAAHGTDVQAMYKRCTKQCTKGCTNGHGQGDVQIY